MLSCSLLKCTLVWEKRHEVRNIIRIRIMQAWLDISQLFWGWRWRRSLNQLGLKLEICGQPSAKFEGHIFNQHPRCCTRFSPLLTSELFQPDSKMPPVPRTAGSAFPLLLWQFTWSYMAGDRTLCRPLIGPPLGMCVFLFMHACICVCMCVCFSGTYQHTQPLYRISPHNLRDWGRKGEVDRCGMKMEGKKSFHCSRFFAPNWKGLTNRGTGSFPLIWENPWQEWCGGPFIALFLLFLFKIALFKDKTTKQL